MNDNTMMGFFGAQAGCGIIVELSTRDDVNVVPEFREMKCELGENLARRRMIREKISVEKKKPAHCTTLSNLSSIPNSSKKEFTVCSSPMSFAIRTKQPVLVGSLLSQDRECSRASL